MPDLRRRNCRHCRRHDSETGPISWSGACEVCARRRLVENIDGIHFKRGEEWKRWRRAMAATVGGVLLDDLQSSE